MSNPSRWRRAFRFSLGGLLFVTLCACVYLGSHRVGERAGVQDQYYESFFVKTYNIDDLLIEAESEAKREQVFAEAMDWIRSTVDPQSWTTPGEHVGAIQQMSWPGTLIISQYGAAHDKVEQALKELRRRRLAEPTRWALSEAESLAERSAAQPVVLVGYPNRPPQANGAVLNRFADLTDALSQQWGAPSFTGECTDEGFPSWSAAQSLAVWPRGDGQVYLAVQDHPQMGRAVVAGWHGGD